MKTQLFIPGVALPPPLGEVEGATDLSGTPQWLFRLVLDLIGRDAFDADLFNDGTFAKVPAPLLYGPAFDTIRNPIPPEEIPPLADGWANPPFSRLSDCVAAVLREFYSARARGTWRWLAVLTPHYAAAWWSRLRAHAYTLQIHKRVQFVQRAGEPWPGAFRYPISVHFLPSLTHRADLDSFVCLADEMMSSESSKVSRGGAPSFDFLNPIAREPGQPRIGGAL
jgi:hypothetical protein